MKKILKALTYSYKRNIGWQDRTIRITFGLLLLTGAIYFYAENLVTSSILGMLFLAQAATVYSSRCMICYFFGWCTITSSEKKSLDERGIEYEE